MDKTKHTIMIVDEAPVIHQGIRSVLAHEEDLTVVAAAESGTEVLDRLKSRQPDLAVVGLPRTGSDVTHLIRTMKNTHATLKILVYSRLEDELFALRVADAGAHGYLMKTVPSEKLITAIRTVLAGNTYFPNSLRRPRTPAHELDGEVRSFIDYLSRREREVFVLVGQNMNSVEIGQKLHISERTVNTHRINIKDKLRLSSGKEVNRMAYEFTRKHAV